MTRITTLFSFGLIIASFILFSHLSVSAQNSQELVWQKANAQTGEVAEIAFAPTNPNIVYLGMEANAHAFYKSLDTGKTWEKISGPGDHAKDVAVSPKDPNKAYVAMSESVHTTDLSIKPTSKSMFDSPFGVFGGGGRQTQTVLSSGVFPGPSSRSFSSFEIFEGNDKIMYASLRGGSTGPLGREKPILYKTVDSGVTWDNVSPNLSEVNVLEIDPVNAEKIYIGASDGAYVSTDLGRNLQKILSSTAILSLELQKNNPNIIASSIKKIYKSVDGGKNWDDITGKLQNIHRVRIARSNPSVYYAATFNGIFRSDNAGSSWQDISSNLKAKNFQIVSIHPQNENIVLAGTSSLWSSVRAEHLWQGGLLAHQGVYRTEDGGKTWTESDTGIFEYDVEEVTVNPTKPYEAWFAASSSRGGFKTEDGGQNWRVTQLQTMHYPMRIKYSLQDPKKIYATSWHSGGPFAYSEDGGVNWTMVDQNAFFKSLNTGKSLYREARGMGQIHVHGLAVDPQNDKIIYVGSVHDAQNPGDYPLQGAHIFKSTDGGKTWTESDNGFLHDAEVAIHDMIVDPGNSNIVYAATTKDEARVGKGVFKSVDSGKTWKAINSGLGSLDTWAIIVNPQDSNILLLATDAGIYRSENGGISWRQTASTPSQDVEYTINDPLVVYASTTQGVLKSTDFGNTWYSANTGLPEGEGQGIGVDTTGKVIYAAVKNHGLYVTRLTDIPLVDKDSEFGRGRGFGGFGRNTFNPFGKGPNFLLILAAVIGIFLVLPVLIFLVVKLKEKR